MPENVDEFPDDMEHRTMTDYDFPEIELSDRLYLQEVENLHGEDRVIGWLRGKVGIPLKHQFDDDFDEDDYYQAMRERFVDTGGAEKTNESEQ